MSMNRNTNYLVKNINGTSDNPPPSGYSSWLDYWRNETGSSRCTCCVMGCSNSAEVGAHVQIKDGRVGNEWYIAPMCKYHNNYHNTEPMYLDSRVTLVSANRSYFPEIKTKFK